ncbi:MULTISPECIES: hypothetical protein [Paenibacillus]|uniref:Uncharacterized protein n=1 Tax=Paenibacillus campinasensis TaxID=66347 RepID=A0A268F0T7_9BACL|nr:MULTISPECIES: hypothetical protein [Paenibacillus]MUG65636.1 hypothetical protein [Paenibacillus campinasensis]PAD78971.1 hypothetical protein CHH67_05135 [Paenibacillus campinasensis]PAK54311.1 hypothetical protein CHH75_08315 [Paenibacillus sp. 7541]
MNKVKFIIIIVITLIVAVLSLRLGFWNLYPPYPATGAIGELPKPKKANAVLYFLSSGIAFIALITYLYRLFKKE